MGARKSRKIGFGLGAVGKDMVYALVSGYILYYFNDVLGISGTFVGVMMMGARIFDALNDPVMGVVVEKTRTRWGRFRPWIMCGTLLNALVLYAMFAVPEILVGSSRLWYISIAYVVWGVTYTLMDIPFWSLIPAITTAGPERESLSVIGRTCASLGSAIPTILTMLVVTRVGSGERDGFAFWAAVIAICFVVAEFVLCLLIREDDIESRPSASLTEMIRALIRNDQAMVVVVGIIVFNASTYLTSQLATYFFKYDIGDSDLVSVFATIGGAGQILAMISLPILRRRFSSIAVLTGAILATIVGYALLFTLATAGIRRIAALGVAAFVIYIGFGLATVLTTIFLADTVDYGEYTTGHRCESVIFSMQTFVVKFASAISIAIAGIGIDLIGLDQSLKVQAEQTLVGLRVLMVALPVVGLVVALVFLRAKYRLTDAENARIAAELKKSRTGRAD